MIYWLLLMANSYVMTHGHSDWALAIEESYTSNTTKSTTDSLMVRTSLNLA
jgi:hypothetical protein